MKRLSVSILFMCFLFSVFGQEILGRWDGTLDIGQTKLRIVFNLSMKDGKLVSNLDSPDQMVKGIPSSLTIFADNELTVEIKQIGASFKGKLVETNEITGIFSQGGMSLPLVLKKNSETTQLTRPQEPKSPYPYITEDVVFRNSNANINLAGTLTLPSEKGNFPAVILVSGSGAQNRNEEIMGHKPFLVIADYLTRNGIAVLRYDDRGVGGSQGVFSKATTTDFTADAKAAFDYLKSRKEIDASRVGVIGHSEGGIIAIKMAANDSDVAFIVTLAAPGVSGDKILLKQIEDLLRAQKIGEETISSELIASKARFDILMQNKDIDSIVAEFTTMVNSTVPNPQARKGIIDSMTSPWYIEFLKYYPQSDLTKIKIPMLALNGEDDIQVNATINIAEIEKNVKPHLTVKKYKGLNHLFQHSNPKFSPLDYEQIEETISPEVLEDIATWITKIVQ